MNRWRVFGAFMAGMVAAINLSCLVDTNPDYDAQWWKVALATSFGICCFLTTNTEEE